MYHWYMVELIDTTLTSFTTFWCNLALCETSYCITNVDLLLLSLLLLKKHSNCRLALADVNEPTTNLLGDSVVYIQYCVRGVVL